MFWEDGVTPFFDLKREYQEKLTARQILEIAQEEFEEGYLEVW